MAALSSSKSARHVLLTGIPGIGKTTLIKKVCSKLVEMGILVQGFYTQERREHGTRVGFDVITFEGKTAPLATISDESALTSKREYRVGKYSVQLQAFQQTAMPTLLTKKASSAPVYVIDEIGKMELFSDAFKVRVQDLLNHPTTMVLATIPVSKGRPIPYVEDIRSRPDTVLFTVTRDNRDGLVEDIVNAVVLSYKAHTG